jgi:hypothetical protein
MVEYQLRSATGRVVCAFDTLELAQRRCNEKTALRLRIYKITRTEEEVAPYPSFQP